MVDTVNSTSLVRGCLPFTLVAVLLASCANATQPPSGADPVRPPASPSNEGLATGLLMARDVPGSWQIETVDGAAVPSLMLCGGSLTPAVDDKLDAVSRLFSASEQAVRHDIFGSIPAESTLTEVRRDLSRCKESVRRTKTGTLPIRVRMVGAMPGLVAARLTAQSSGATAENLVLIGVRDGDLHVVTIYDTRTAGAGALSIALQRWLTSPS